MEPDNDTLAQLLRRIAQQVDDGGDSSNIATIVEPLRLIVAPGCYEGRGADMDHTDEGYRLQLEWFAGQLLTFVDGHHWGMINSWLNCTDKFTTRKGK